MPTLQDVNEFIFSNLVNVSTSKSGTHFHGRCPVCGDSKKTLSKKRFHLQFDDEYSIYWKCWNCNNSGNFYDLYASLNGITSEEAYKYFNKFDPKNIYNRLENKPKQKIINKKASNYESFNYILNDCISLEDNCDGIIQQKYQQKLKEFVENRKINQKLYIAYKGDFKGRIIIPIWENDNIIYFQGRSIFNDVEPKYFNPTVEKNNIILNKNNFDKNKYIIVTEGLLDADCVDNQGTSIIGKELLKDFYKKIKKYSDKGVILVLDNDKDGYEQILKYINKYKDIYYFLMPKKYIHIKDLNELISKEYINKSNIYQFVVDNSYTNDKCKAKIIFEKRR